MRICRQFFLRTVATAVLAVGCADNMGAVSRTVAAKKAGTTSTDQASYGYLDINPEVIAAGEDSLRLTWHAPLQSQQIHHYDVYVSELAASKPDFNKPPVFTVTDPSATSAVATGITHGSVGRVVIRARTIDPSTAQASVDGTSYWTPFGAINWTSVNKIEWITGLLVSGSATLAMSDNFSYISGHTWLPEGSQIFKGLPDRMQPPLFNYASRNIKYTPSVEGRRVPRMGGWPSDPVDAFTDGRRFLVSANYDKIMIYNTLPLTVEQAANPSVILGFAASGLGALGTWSHTCVDGDRLYVATWNNGWSTTNTLVYNTWPTVDNQAPDFQLHAGAGGAASQSDYSAYGFACGFGKLAIADTNRNRILIWNTPPTSAETLPDIVLGQSLFTESSANSANVGGVAGGGLSGPRHLLFVPNGAGVALLASDNGNRRVVQWDNIPTSNGAAWDRTYGQKKDSTTATGLSDSLIGDAGKLSAEYAADGIQRSAFWLMDAGNQRVLRFQLNNKVADSVAGKADFTTSGERAGCTTRTKICFRNYFDTFFRIDSASGIVTSVSDFYRMWKLGPKNGLTPYDLDTPSGGTFVTGTASKTFVSANERIAIYNVAPKAITATDAPANVLGRRTAADLVNTSVPDTHEYKITPAQLIVAGTKLLVADGPRVAVYDLTTITDHEAISVVIGQPGKTTKTANQGGVSAVTLSSTSGMAYHNGKLIVADSGNNRVLIWNALPTSDGASADVVLGQPDFTTVTSGTTPEKMNNPLGVAILNGKLIVSDTNNSRLLIWDSIPTASNTNPSRIWSTAEKARFSLPSWFHPTSMLPRFIGAYDGRLYIEMIDRMMVLPDIF